MPVLRCASETSCFLRGQPPCPTGRYCNFDSGDCAPIPGEGQPCSESSGGICGTGLTCVTLFGPTPISTCRRPADEGGDCQNDRHCAEGLFCNQVFERFGPTGTCRKPGPAGASCSSLALCEGGLICQFTGRPPGMCRTPPKDGEMCYRPDECAVGLFCDMFNGNFGNRPGPFGMCRPSKVLGEACAGFFGNVCARDLFCRVEPSQPRARDAGAPRSSPETDAGATPTEPPPPPPRPLPTQPPGPPVGMCERRASDGQPCAQGGCSPDSYCHAMRAVCVPASFDGGPCGRADGASCRAGLVCFSTGGDSGTCAPLNKPPQMGPGARSQEPPPMPVHLPGMWPFRCGLPINFVDDDD